MIGGIFGAEECPNCKLGQHYQCTKKKMKRGLPFCCCGLSLLAFSGDDK